jgi:hypothetical protein
MGRLFADTQAESFVFYYFSDREKNLKYCQPTIGTLASPTSRHKTKLAKEPILTPSYF